MFEAGGQVRSLASEQLDRTPEIGVRGDDLIFSRLFKRGASCVAKLPFRLCMSRSRSSPQLHRAILLRVRVYGSSLRKDTSQHSNSRPSLPRALQINRPEPVLLCVLACHCSQNVLAEAADSDTASAGSMMAVRIHFVDTRTVGIRVVGILATGHSRAVVVESSLVDGVPRFVGRKAGMTAVGWPRCSAAAAAAAALVVALVEGYGYVGRKMGEGRSQRHSFSRTMNEYETICGRRGQVYGKIRQRSYASKVQKNRCSNFEVGENWFLWRLGRSNKCEVAKRSNQTLTMVTKILGFEASLAPMRGELEADVKRSSKIL